MKNITKEIRDTLWDLNTIKDAIDYQMWRQVYCNMRSHIWYLVREEVRDPIRSQLKDLIK